MGMKDVLPLGVFASIGARLGASLKSVQAMGISTVHFCVPPVDRQTPEDVAPGKSGLAEAGIEITLVFCAFPQESYKTIQAVRDTVGLVPPATRDERIEMFRQDADFAAALGAPAVGIHLGFISPDWESRDFADLVGVVKGMCEYCSAVGVALHLETGQETADTLLHFIQQVSRPNLWVNFDPANMILYGSGEPLEALGKVGRYVRSCHCKDATWAERPRDEWGEEVPLGQGDVNVERFLAALIDLGYRGPLTIEREISGDQQARDIKEAIDLLESLKGKLLAG